MNADITKQRSLIAHIARNRPKLGKLRLFKLLYLIDFDAYAKLGHSITGERYENFEMGPVPVTLWKSFQGITSICVTIESVPTVLGFNEQQMTARPDFDVVLEPEEVEVADQILAQFGDYSGNSLKDLTHRQIPYLATPRGDIIPYGLAGYLFYKRPTESQADEIRANAPLMKRLQGAVLANRSKAA